MYRVQIEKQINDKFGEKKFKPYTDQSPPMD